MKRVKAIALFVAKGSEDEPEQLCAGEPGECKAAARAKAQGDLDGGVVEVWTSARGRVYRSIGNLKAKSKAQAESREKAAKLAAEQQKAAKEKKLAELQAEIDRIEGKEQPPPKKRGRPPGSKNKPKPEAEAPAAEEAE